MNYKKIKLLISKFIRERSWKKYHTPKNLSMALSVEASELLEIFQWVNDKDFNKNKNFIKARAQEEIADIFYYLICISEKMNINLEDAIISKMKKNEQKYPRHLSKGKFVKR
jgi:NTP pyrophosphatase (non-canonical NTP hydrolase)